MRPGALEQRIERFIRKACCVEEDTVRRVGDPQSPNWQAAEKPLVEFIQMSREHHVPMGIVLVPYFMPLNGQEYP